MNITRRELEIGRLAFEETPSIAAERLGVKWSTADRNMRTYKAWLRDEAEKFVTPEVDAPVEQPIVGVIGDTHFPFTRRGYKQHCKETFEKHGVTEVVHIGDVIDNHAISRHKSEPIADGVITEYEKAKAMVEDWAHTFPKMKICMGNHDAILERQAAELGVPKLFIKDLHELYEMPEGWEIAESFQVSDVLYKHGIGAGGMHGAYNSAKRNCMSVVQGHTHAFAGVKYIATPQKLWFGMSVGCGIDIEAYAFTYGKHYENRPILGCGVVKSSKEGIFVPLDMETH